MKKWFLILLEEREWVKRVCVSWQKVIDDDPVAMIRWPYIGCHVYHWTNCNLTPVLGLRLARPWLKIDLRTFLQFLRLWD